MRWKNFGEMNTEEGHKVYFSGKEDKHEHGVGFLVHKETVKSVMGCEPINSRLIKIRLKAKPFNISIIQAYAPTTDHSEDEIEGFYDQLQEVIDKVHKKDIVIVQGDWNAKIGKDVSQNWKDTCGTSCNDNTNERGLRLLEFANSNNFIAANTIGDHKKSRRMTWHSPGGLYHNQIDYIFVQTRFKSSVRVSKTRTFPGADIGSDHDLVMMNFQLHLKNIDKPKHTRLKFDLSKLKDPSVAEAFQASIGGRFAALSVIDTDDQSSVESIVENFNTAVNEAAKETLGKHRPIKKPWVTPEILDLCDKRRELKQKKNEESGKIKYKTVDKQINYEMKKAKDNWIEKQCSEIEENLKRNNSKMAYSIVKDLTTPKQGRCSAIQNKAGKCLTEEQEILERWTEYCSDLYNYKTNGNPEVLNVPPASNVDKYPILRDEVEQAVKSLKHGKSAGVDNIPSELVNSGGEAMIDALTVICNKIWETGEWPTSWTQSLIITLPKKGNLQQCQNYRTISLISHPSKVMLKILLNRLKPESEEIIAEEQAGFRAGRSTIEQIFNLRLVCEKYQQHQQDLYHIFIDFKKAFDRVWHEALWATMNHFNINSNLTHAIQNLYNNATSAVFSNGNVGQWFRTTVGVRQGCLLSPTLFNIFLERIMTEALDGHDCSVNIGGRTLSNLRFADDIDGLAGNEQELANLADRLDKASTKFGMEISAEKTKVMTNKSEDIQADIEISGQKLESVKKFKYLGAIISDEGSKVEVLARIAQTTAALGKLKPIWKDKKISTSSKVKLMRSLVLAIFLYACETWTLTAELEKRIEALETRCFRRVLGISYKDHITNVEVKRQIKQAIGEYVDLLSIVKKRKLRWYGHVTRSNGLAKTILQGTVQGTRKRGRQRKRWEDNIVEWTGQSLATCLRRAENREQWRKKVESSLVATQWSKRLSDR